MNRADCPIAVSFCRDYIADHYCQNISLTELSRLVGLNASYLTRLFRKHMGMPPHSWQIQVRIHRAKELIRQGLPLVEVAAITGFSDQSHLTRHFRKSLGITPGVYGCK
ncbi:AraC family transcriptional regulator [Parendozoicomonas sp. Alg238-R29]|uniref:helix-turn-helix transcriptional regulator n=1 Tax=Parendozoicomonas sp. Alg238-R29 TaxID=2993446 RepID=UPI00248DB02B|nr:AraC family transcriptional regulator [Parendozoicomonas sp. Alg238-R29]